MDNVLISCNKSTTVTWSCYYSRTSLYKMRCKCICQHCTVFLFVILLLFIISTKYQKCYHTTIKNWQWHLQCFHCPTLTSCCLHLDTPLLFLLFYSKLDTAKVYCCPPQLTGLCFGLLAFNFNENSFHILILQGLVSQDLIIPPWCLTSLKAQSGQHTTEPNVTFCSTIIGMKLPSLMILEFLVSADNEQFTLSS